MRVLVSCAFLLALALGFGSCANHRDQWKDSVDVPAKWKGSSQKGGSLDTAALKKWWKRFGDPTLDELIAKAMASSPDIKTAISKVAQSRGERSVQLAGLLPSVTGNASDRLQRRDEQSTGLVTRSETYNLSLDMSWEVDLFGRQMQNLSAATKDVQQTIDNYYAAQVTLTGDVAMAYITYRAAQAQLDVVRRNIETRRETTEITRWQQEAGVSDTLELQQAVSTLEQARAAIPALEQTISETKNQLAVLCGQAPGALDRLLDRSGSIPRVPARIAVGIPADALNNRPDVRAAVNGVLAAYYRKTAAELERFPTINLDGSLGLEALRTGTIFSPEAAARTLAGSLLASLAQPIFEGGAITANIHINEELAKQAVYSFQSTVLSALSEVEDALVATRKTAERLDTLRKADAAAQEASQLATQQYQAGEVELLTVLDTQRTQLSVEEERVNTEADQVKAYVQLYKSLGGGWQPL
ncbi:efflux transporter outer membrane subunit [Terrimicrobium sacchariphilum]|uniref:efflux transporter outer membrane subunit n=1 Tax=Terrimicrobium sacchariphilum TaxID=690879 RepID=UPI00192CE738|nr:efflux transporter outer membrane subunit [Terrimicrobium sacchariphilum]